MIRKTVAVILTLAIISMLLFSWVAQLNDTTIDIPHRESLIPNDAVKITPEMDLHPPITISDEYEQPIPLPYPVNTRGAEDSTFIMPDGNTLYLWFTPDTKGDVYAQARARNLNGCG